MTMTTNNQQSKVEQATRLILNIMQRDQHNKRDVLFDALYDADQYSHYDRRGEEIDGLIDNRGIWASLYKELMLDELLLNTKEYLAELLADNEELFDEAIETLERAEQVISK